MPEPVRGDQKYLPGLDGLRALAAASATWLRPWIEARVTAAFGARGRLTDSPLVLGGLCLATAVGVTATVAVTTDMTPRSAPGGASAAVAGVPARTTGPWAAAGRLAAAASPLGGALTAVPAAVPAALVAEAQVGTSAGAAGGAPAGSPAAPVKPGSAPRTSCRSVVHIGDSTSEGLTWPDYLPNPAQRITARYAQVGVTHSIMKVSGGTSIVETVGDGPNAYQVARQLVGSGYHGCWVLALGTSDTADVYTGSAVDRTARIKKMMSLIGRSRCCGSR